MRVLLWLVLSLCLLGIAHAQNRSFVRTPEATIHFVHETKFDAENSSVRVGFFFQLEPHWHIYWRNPGDSGLPPKVDWVNSQSYHFSDFDWPTPKRIRINILANYGYDNEILLPLTVTRKSKETPQIEANLSWLVCKEECIPRQANLLLDPTKTPSFNIDFDKGQAKSLKRWEWKSLKVNEQKLVANLMVGIPAQDIEINEIDFFPVESGIIKAFHPPSAKVLSSENGSSLLQMVFESALNDSNRKIDSFYGILKVSSSQSYKLQKDNAKISNIEKASSSAVPPSIIGAGKATSIGKADGATPSNRFAVGNFSKSTPGVSPEKFMSLWIIVFAFVGGFILNFMPCVFPILAIKIFDFSHKKTDSRRELRVQSYFYLFGILVCFWTLALLLLGLRAEGSQIGWGFQLQSSTFVLILAVIFTLLALNFWGLFEFYLPLLSRMTSLKVQEGRLGAFLSGLLTTIVSTPCTAPFLGVALSVALVLPAFESVVIFSAMGLGVGFPYVALVHIPMLSRNIPEPGPWMHELKQILGFFLMATVIWLLWVFGRQQGLASLVWAMSGLLSIAFVVSWRGFAKYFFRGIALTLAVGFLAFARYEFKDQVEWSKFDADRVEQLARDHIVFIDFTASWCLTCQVNKAIALEKDSVMNAFKKFDVQLFRADWTNQNGAITRALESYGRSSVPTNVILGPMGKEAKVLPTILTPFDVISNIEARSK